MAKKQKRSSVEQPKPWVMPGWMEPYRAQLLDHSLGVEDLMNDRVSTFCPPNDLPPLAAPRQSNNEYRAALCVAMTFQVALLTRLRDEGLLRDPSFYANGSPAARRLRGALKELEWLLIGVAVSI